MKKVEVVINGYRYDLPDGFAFNLKHIVDFYCEGSGNGKFLGKVVDESGFVAVPESLDIVNSINRKTLGIVFNNNNNVLWFAHNLWSVTENNDLWESVKCKLVECSESDLKKGDLVYFSNDGLNMIKCSDYYGLYLGDSLIRCNGDSGVSVTKTNFENYYKVERV